MEMLSASVAELLERVLPPGSKLLAGESGAFREVTWASTLRVRPPAFPTLGPGEMALLASDWLEMIDPPIGLNQVVDALAQRGAAAVGVMGQVALNAVQRADDLGIPLISLPEGTNLYETEGAIGRFISQQRTSLYQRAGDIHSRLMEASIQGKGMLGLLWVLAQATGKAAALLDQAHRPRHVAAPPGIRLIAQELASAVADDALLNLEAGLTAQHGGDQPVARLPVALPGLQAMGCAVSLGSQVSGYLMLIGPAGQLGSLERLALAQASSVFASEMAKEKAVIQAESRLRGGFLEDVLEGQLEDEAEVASRASYLGYDILGPSVVVALAIEPGHNRNVAVHGVNDELLHRIADALPRQAPSMIKDDVVALVMRVDENCEKGHPAAGAEAIRARVSGAVKDAAIMAGVGRCHTGLHGLRRSYQEARRALALGKDTMPRGHTHFFGDLGIYPVLFPLWGSRESVSFVEETLGALLAYDQQNHTELVTTLDSYLAHGSNLNRTAETLHLHRNSLAYRIRRIEEVAGVSLDDSENCFRMQLALKLHRLESS